MQGIHRIARESGDRLCQDHVDFSPPALADHPQKLRALLRGSAGDSFVSEQARHCPLGILHDLIRVVGPLRFVTGKLLLVIGGDTAIRRDSELPLVSLPGGEFRLGWDRDDAPRGILHAGSLPIRKSARF